MCPPGDGYEKDDRLPLVLGGGRAFGSGLHETTKSCIEMIEELAPLNGKHVLDMGTGTGILSIATILLGASQVIAFDIEPEAAG